MEASLKEAEYTYWLAYFEEEGYPEDREDLRLATLAAVIANMSGKTLRRQVEPGTFLPNKWAGPVTAEKEPTGETLGDFIKRLKAAQKR